MSVRTAIYSEYPITASDIQILSERAREHIDLSRVRYLTELIGMWYGADVADEVSSFISSSGESVEAGTLDSILHGIEERLQMIDDGQASLSDEFVELLSDFADGLREVVAEPGHRMRSYNIQIWD